MSDKPIAYKASSYAWMVQHITIIARRYGYAIGLHGSLHNDLDLIAVPWTEDAKPAEELVEGILEDIDGKLHNICLDAAGVKFENPADKPHGRRAWNIFFSGPHFYIDLSVMPLLPKKPCPET